MTLAGPEPCVSCADSTRPEHREQDASGGWWCASCWADERYTPLELVRGLHARWSFTLDAASAPGTPSAQLIGKHWTAKDDGLLQPWNGERVWCNPPYSDLRAWVEKAWASLAVVVMLLPANRTEQPWWQELVEPHRDKRGGGVRTEFLKGRLNFGTPAAPEGFQWRSSPPFGCVLLVWPSPERRPLQMVLPAQRRRR